MFLINWEKPGWGLGKTYVIINDFMNKNNTKKRNNGTGKSEIVSSVLRSLERKKQIKFLNLYSSTSLSTTSVFTDLSSIAEGTTVYQRVGASVRAVSLRLRISISMADTYNFVRFLIFRWRVSDTSDAPGTPEILDTVGGSCPTYLANFLLYRPSRFSILLDKTFYGTTGNWQAVQMLDTTVRLGWDVEYDVGVNTGKDHVYCMMVSDSAAVSHPTVNMSSQLVYHDTE